MDIMLTVSYSLKISKDEFFDPKTGYVKEDMEEQLDKLFPKEIVLAENAVAQRAHLIHAPLYESQNCLRCASCGRWLCMPGKAPLPGLDPCKFIKEIPLCSSCAWELEFDLMHGNEKFIQELRKKRNEME